MEQKLLSENTKYKLSKNQRSTWLNYAVIQEFPTGMPWDGAEEKKQKQGTNIAHLAYVLHAHETDYERMKKLLTYAKDWKVWHKCWGNKGFAIEIPTEKSTQTQKTKYIQMIQTHGSVQLSMGAAMLERLIDADTTFTLLLLPDADGNERPLPWSNPYRKYSTLWRSMTKR